MGTVIQTLSYQQEQPNLTSMFSRIVMIPCVFFVVLAIPTISACSAGDEEKPANGTDTATKAPNAAADKIHKITEWTTGMDEIEQCVVTGTKVEWTWASGTHNVVKIADETKYNDCTLAAGMTDANTDKKFTSAALTNGKHYFVCGIGADAAHCKNGMKATIEVKDTCP